MNEFPKHANVVIIGSGITGASIAYFLSELGWKDIVVIDQGKLPKPGGSSSHAPGGMFQTNSSKLMVDAAHFGVHFYKSLEFNGESGAVLNGGIELAESEERLKELHRRCGLGRSFGLEGEVINPNECGKLLPHLDISKIKGGYWVPDDGVGRALVCTQSLQEKAEKNGVKFFGEVTVSDIITKSNSKTGQSLVEFVETNKGTISAEKIVCCAGFWGPKIGRMVGQPIPLMPMAHLYAISQSIPELKGAQEEIQMPITRAQDHDLYFRQHHDKWSVGYYGHEAKPLWAENILSPEMAPIMPSIVDWDAEAFEPGWKAAANLFPSIGRDQNLSYNINGIFSFTPDGQSLMGESLKVKNFWVAEAFWYTHASGLAKILAEWMDSGEPQVDCHEADLNRFYPHAHSRPYVKQRGIRQYVEVYDILHPKDPSLAYRNVRQSPIQQRHLDYGGYMLEAAGYERPQWYEKNNHLLDKLPNTLIPRDDWSAKHYSTIEAAEAWVTRNEVAVYDLSAFAILAVSGQNALVELQKLCTNKIDVPIGRMVYTNLLDDNGGIVCDLTVMRRGLNDFWLPTGGGAGPHDFAWLKQNLPDDGSIHLTDISSQYCILGLWGPKTRDLLHSISENDFSNENHKFFHFKEIFVEEIPVTAARLSYVGEQGYELYVLPEYALALWDKLTTAGAIPCGQGAFDSLRLEKGMRGWGADLDPDHTPLEAGLSFIVKYTHDFKGKSVLEKQQNEGLNQKLCTMTIDDGQVFLGSEPIFSSKTGGECLGYLTSANYGYTIDESIGMGYIKKNHNAIGEEVWIDYFGKRHKARITEEVIFDPKSLRVRA